MNFNVVGNMLGKLLMYLSALMVPPFLFAYYYNEILSFYAFLWSIVITFLVGYILHRIYLFKNGIGSKESYLIATLGWLLVAGFSTLPFLFTGTIEVFLDAYFECMSGYTATGATILTDIESNPLSILLWRNEIQWVGGMGIILLVVALLPILGVGGMRLLKSEFPGFELDKIKPRIIDTAKTIWLIYIFITLGEIICLYGFGMPLYDAVVNTFGTVPTGGFNHKNLSIAYYNNIIFEIIIIFFMFISAVNFSLHYRFFHREKTVYFKDQEFLFFTSIVCFSTLLITLQLSYSVYDSMLTAVRYALFQVVSIVTTTGFVNANYSLWPDFSQLILVLLMFLGGCVGSTAGAIKSVRFLLLLKQLKQSFERILHPNAVLPVRLGGKVVPEDIMQSIRSFFLLYVFIFIIGVFIITGTGLDIVSAIGAIAATLGGVGPGLGLVGPAENYAFISSIGKITLIICMLLGRLEIFTVLILLVPEFWKK
jgi:trk system potassium uptake protein TrkH